MVRPTSYENTVAGIILAAIIAGGAAGIVYRALDGGAAIAVTIMAVGFSVGVVLMGYSMDVAATERPVDGSPEGYDIDDPYNRRGGDR